MVLHEDVAMAQDSNLTFELYSLMTVLNQHVEVVVCYFYVGTYHGSMVVMPKVQVL